jgi:hypothetical protein
LLIDNELRISENEFRVSKIGILFEIADLKLMIAECRLMINSLKSAILNSSNSSAFSRTTGAASLALFESAFYNCSRLVSIGENFVGTLTSAGLYHTFYRTFMGCTALTGESAKMTNGVKIDMLSDSTTSNERCYRNCTGLSNYVSIPAKWK